MSDVPDDDDGIGHEDDGESGDDEAPQDE